MQMYWLSVSIFFAFWLTIGYLVVRAWMRWARSKTDHSAPKWRSWIAACGFAASNISLLMIIVVMSSGYFSHAYIPDTPLGLLALRVTFLTALAGIIAALAGTGPLKTPSAICSSGGLL